jgi:hypothetical protein
VRVLEISRDPVFKSVYPQLTSWLQIGPLLEPYNQYTGLPELTRCRAASAVICLLLRRYDLIIFPAVRERFRGDKRSPRKAKIRHLLTRLASQPTTARIITVLLGLEGITHIIRDVTDRPDLGEVSLSLLPYATLYAKRQVLVEQLGKHVGGGSKNKGPALIYLPMAFETKVYLSVVKGEKKNDVFFAGQVNSPHRKQAVEVLEELRSEKLRIDMPQERIPFKDYLRRMSEAWLVVSPKGFGEHCYRHYEALLMGSVPVINEPERPVYYDLKHGESCLFYDPTPEGLKHCIRTALTDKEKLEKIARIGAELVKTVHDKEAICASLLAKVQMLDSLNRE